MTWVDPSLRPTGAAAVLIVMPLLDERQRRILADAGAKMLGRGGVSIVSRSAEMCRNTVITGAKEIDSAAVPVDRVRREGGVRRRLIDKDPYLLLELDDLVSPNARGDPMSPLRWTSKSTYHLAEALNEQGFEISPRTAGSLLGAWCKEAEAHGYPPSRHKCQWGSCS